jgi:CheY-like chemotaxis protein
MADILIVDDESEYREKLKEIIGESEHRITEAASGTEALEMIGNANFDVMLLDIIMPGLHGLDVLEKVSSISPEMPVLIVGSKKEKLLIKRALDAGAKGCIRKPFEDDKVREVFSAAVADFVKEREKKKTLERIASIAKSACKFEEVTSSAGDQPLWENKTALSNSIEMIAKYLAVEKVSLTQIDLDKESIQLIVGSGFEVTEDKQQEQPMGKGPASVVARDGKPLLVTNISEDERFSDLQRAGRYDDSSFVVAPIVAEGKVVGVISANDKKSKKPFHEQDLLLLTIFAGQMGQMLEKSKLVQHLQLENLRMRLTSKLTTILVNEVEPEQVFVKTVALARETLNCSAAYLMVQPEDGGDFEFVAGADALGSLEANFKATNGKGLTGMVIQTGETISVPGAAEDEMFVPEIDGQVMEKPNTFVASPLKLKNQVLGVIVCLNKSSANCFSDNDESALHTIALGTSVALKNAWLHHNVVKMIDQVADSEKVVTSLKQKLAKAYLLIEALKRKITG